MSHKIILLLAIILFFSIEVYAKQPQQKSEIEKFRKLELQVHRLQRDFDLYLRKVNSEPFHESKSKIQKTRLLSQLRRIEKKVQGDLSIHALKVMKDVHDFREKLRKMDREVNNIRARNEAMSFAKNKTFKREHPESKIPQNAITSLISGTVTDETGTIAIADTEVDIFDSDGDWVTYGYTDSTGAYSVFVDDGTYFARTYSYNNYVDELYSEIQCEPYCNVTTGTPIVVAGGAQGINFTLAPSGNIAGTIVDAATNTPISDISIDLYDSNGDWRAYASTDTAGHYFSIGGLTTGSYFAVARDYYQGYIGELYQDLPCYGDCNIQNGTPISVTQGQITNGIDFTLDKGGSISGKLLNAANSSPIYGYIDIYDSAGNEITNSSVDKSGNYQVTGLPAGNYFAISVNYENFIDELYDNIVCYQNYCEPQAGTPIAVALGQTTNNINFLLDRGGIIRGHVKDQNTAKPIEYASIDIFDTTGNYVAYGYTDHNGSYAVKGLIGGTYFAATSTYGDYIDELYDDIECPAYTCDPLIGTPIEVKIGESSQVNFDLMPAGRIAGKTVDSSDGQPIPYTDVSIYDSTGSSAGYGYTDERGKYVTSGLPAGNYFAVTFSYYDNYIDELYDNQPCPLQNCNVITGQPISVTTGQTTTGINFALDPGGSISGTVTGSDSNPITSFNTLVFDAQGSYVRSGHSTGENGEYVVGGLPSGNYYSVTVNWDKHVDELYDNIPCTRALCNPLIGTPITVTKGSDTSGVNFVLDPGGSISGKIYDAQTAAPIEYSYVNVYDSSGNSVSYGYTDETGTYHAEYVGLSTGTYFATSYSYYDDYLNELYDNIPCNNNCNVLTGTPIQVTAGSDTANIDFALDHGGKITGKIIDADTSLPITYAYIDVYDASGIQVSSGYADDAGNYTAWSLETGTYYVVTRSYDHINELYNDVVCPQGECNPLSGTSISVVAGAETSGIDFDLKTCGDLVFTPLLLPSGVVGVDYQQVISISGGTAPYTINVGSGYLPGGITLDEETGIISGIPTGSGFFGFVLEAIDSNGCSSEWTYSIVINSGSSEYDDDFEDGALAPDWSYKGQWMEMAGSLTTSATKKSTAASGNNFAGCVNCTLNTTLRSNSTQGYVSVSGWYPDHKNYVELIMKAGRNRWILKQRSGGRTVAKEKASVDVQPDVTYDVSITFDGINFVVSVNNQTIITMRAGAVPAAGKVAYAVKSTAGFFDYIHIH